MKLRTKLTLITALITAGGVLISTLLILGFIRRETESNIVSVGIEDLAGFYNEFSDTPFPIDVEDVVMQSELRNRLNHISGASEYALTKNGQILSNNTGIDVDKALSSKGYSELSVSRFESPVRYILCRIAGQDYLLVSADFIIVDEAYTLSLVRNTTTDMDAIRTMGTKCAAVGVGIVAVAATLALFFTRRSLKTVVALEAGAAKIAAGSYSSRIPVMGNDEIAALSDQFNRMASAISEKITELNETASRQRMFISGLSHEMKTPITSILARSETLLSRDISEKDQRHSLERIYDQCAWLERLSSKLTTLTMLEGNIETKLINISELFDSVKEMMGTTLDEKKITLITKCNVIALLMDADLMRSVIINLLENAKRASENGSQIELLAYDNVIEVKDYGHGISAEEIDRITEPFYMIDRSRSKKNGGVGLGLALVKRITEAHKVDLVIISTVGIGTSVKLIWCDIDN
ncbi:MAG TPA: HAMP domain-containing sensor histidine kinase [Negativicutes bacterium]|nr:HAMP domain-containing sensor histidine kinase [Negativicutes bacterium]